MKAWNSHVVMSCLKSLILFQGENYFPYVARRWATITMWRAVTSREKLWELDGMKMLDIGLETFLVGLETFKT